jgi:predicted oxidoreductase
LTISKLIAGTMTWGSWGKNLNKKEMIDLILSFLEEKITTFDHADIYGAHTTETDFGHAFKESGIARENIQLISKCGIKQVAENRNYSIKHYDYSEAHIIWSVENSLKNLQTDYLDVLLLHRPSPLMQSEEIANAIEKLKSQGKIKSFGVSNFTSLQTELLQKNINIDYNQIQFSATNHEAMSNGSLDYMQIHQITPMAWNPLGTIYKENNEQTLRLSKVIKQLTVKYDCPAETILLSWIIKHPAGIVPVIGTTNFDRIKNSAKALELSIELEDWFSIWSESIGSKVP